MKRWTLTALLVISLGINIGFLLHWVWPKTDAGKESGSRAGWHSGPMKRHLGLSSEQGQRLENERQRLLAQARPLQEKLRQKRRDLLALLQGREVNEAELDSTLGEIARLQAALEKMFVLHALQVRRDFSPAQLRKYDGCLERGLCPGMMTAASCPSGSMAGHGAVQPGCENANEAKK